MKIIKEINKMSVKLIIDSASYINEKEAQELGIKIINEDEFLSFL